MKNQTTAFHEGVTSGEATQDFLLISNTATIPTYFSANDGDFTSDGITIDQEYCDTEDLTFGHAPADKMDFTLINNNGSLNDFPWGEMSAFVAVKTEDVSYTYGVKFPREANCGFFFTETDDAVYSFYGANDGIYRVAYSITNGTYTTTRAYQTSVDIKSMVLYRFGTTKAIALGDGICISFYINNNGVPSQFTEVTPNRHMAQKLIEGRSVAFEHIEDEDENDYRIMRIYEANQDLSYEQYELCSMGVFNVNEPDSLQNETVAFNDIMSVITNFDVDATSFIANESYPISYSDFIEDVCGVVNMSVDLTDLMNDLSDEQIPTNPYTDDASHSLRQILAQVCEVYGASATIVRDSYLERNVVRLTPCVTRAINQHIPETIHADRIAQGSLSYKEYLTQTIGTLRMKKCDGSTYDIDLTWFDSHTGADDGIYQTNGNPIIDVSTIEYIEETGDKYAEGGLKQLVWATNTLFFGHSTPFRATIIYADPSVEIGDPVQIFTIEPDTVPKYDIYGREIVGQYETASSFMSPIMKRTFRWQGICLADYQCTGNVERELDTASQPYSNSFAVQYTNNVIKSAKIGADNLFQATGTGDVSLSAGTITQIPLTSTESVIVNTGFSVAPDGGIVVAEAGTYRICGSVYHNISASSNITRVGTYIMYGETFATATELSSTYITRVSGTNASGSYGVPSKIVELDALDKIYLAARVAGDTGTAVGNNIATWLLVEKLNANGEHEDPSYKSAYKNKTLSILGDSISTYLNYIPSGNANYYTGENAGVTSVNDTWWMKLMNALGMTLKLNQSWSGSRVTTTNGDTSAGCMTRCQNLGTNPDVIIVYMGINDFNNEVALGTYNGNGTFPTATTTFREAYAIMLDKIMTAYPLAQVWCATLPPCERNGDTTPPEKNENSVLLNDFNEAIRELAKVFGARILEHAQCGLTYRNMSTFMGDWASATGRGLHPNAQGHSLIANNDIWQMDASCTKRY